MKRYVRILVSILLSVSLFSSAFAVDTAIVTKPSYASGSTVRMRQEPNGKVLVNIPFGTEVEVLSEQGEWMQIYFDNQIGWMKGEFLSPVHSSSGFLSFDVTGEWYEWYTVTDLATAYDREEPADSRFGIDRFFTEDLFVPSDGRVRSIQMTSDGRYIFDNWTDCEVYRNDALYTLDEYGNASASLCFVDADTMWYYGNNEYVAVYKRESPSTNNPILSTSTNNYPEEIQRILERRIFVFRDDFPELYSSVVNMLKTIVYTKDWTLGNILNDEVFETLSWDVQEIDSRVKLVYFTGTLLTNGRRDNIEIEFYVQQDAAFPIALTMTIKNELYETGVFLDELLDAGIDIEFASISADANIAICLSTCYLASDVYVDSKIEISNESISNSDAALIKQVLDRKIFQIANLSEIELWSEFATNLGEDVMDILHNIEYAKDWTFGHILNETIFEKVGWQVYDMAGIKIINFTGSLRTNGSITQIILEFCLLNNVEFPIAWSIYYVDETGHNGKSVEDSLKNRDLEEDEFMTELLGTSLMGELIVAYTLTKLLPEMSVFPDTYSKSNTKSPYDEIINLYHSALSDVDFWDRYTEAELNLFAIQDCLSYGETMQYAVQDINQDGCNELLIANVSEEYISIIDIYTTNGTNAIRLFGERSFGYRDNIDILTDGRLYTHGSSAASNIAYAVYSFTSDGFLEEIQAVDYSGVDMTIVEQLMELYNSMVVDIEHSYLWSNVN